MNVADLMTPAPIHIEADADVDTAVGLMDQHAVRHLPVVDQGRFVGVVSDRDLLEATGWLPRRVREARAGASATSRRPCIREIMHSPAMHAEPEDDILTLSIEAVVQGLGCVPVVKDGHVLGIVTERDMLKAYLEHARLAPTNSAEPLVAQAMTQPARWIHRTATLQEARDECQRSRVRHLPVLEDGRLVGILSDRDLRRAVGRGCREDHAVDELMTRRPITIAPGTLVSQAARLFMSHHCSALPVVADGELVGILTIEDLIDPCMKAIHV